MRIRCPLAFRCFLLISALFWTHALCAQSQAPNLLLKADDTTETLHHEVTTKTLSAFAYPEADAPATNYDYLRIKMKEVLLAHQADPARTGIYVKDCDFGIVPFEWNSDIGFAPGSTLKILTAAAALDLLGAEYTYKTTAEMSGALSDGTFFGSMIIHGSGDPSLGSQMGLNAPPAESVFLQWADALKKAGIYRITGSIVADDTCFDGQYEIPSWPSQDRGEWHVSQIGGLSFADNCVDIIFLGGSKAGKKTAFSLHPVTKYILLHNGTFTGAKGEPGVVRVRRQEGSNLINATGFVPPKGQVRVRASIHNPPHYFATVLRETLISQKIAVDGPAIPIRGAGSEISLSTSSWPVAQYISPPLAEIIRIANQYGQNYYADMVLKTLGMATRKNGSFSAGVATLQDYLRDIKIGDRECVLVDGSGLSNENAVSAGLLCGLLEKAQSGVNAIPFAQSLCRPGQYGLLQNRFKDLLDSSPEAASRILAVSGFSGSGYSLAGYATTAGGIRFAFAFLLNDSRLGYAKASALLDALASEIAVASIRKP